MNMLTIIRELIRRDCGDRKTLGGGLKLEYCPPGLGDPHHIFRLSRAGVFPAEAELNSVKLRLLTASHILGRPIDEDTLTFFSYSERVGKGEATHGFELRWRDATAQPSMRVAI